MSITVATTTIRIERPAATDRSDDPWDGANPPPDIVATGVRAHLGTVEGSATEDGGEETVLRRLLCDPADVRHLDRVVDETTGVPYEVVWAELRRSAPGSGLEDLDHVVGSVSMVTGQS